MSSAYQLIWKLIVQSEHFANKYISEWCLFTLSGFSWRGRVLLWSHSTFVCGFHAVTITPPKWREGKRSLKLEPFLSHWERNHTRLELIKSQHFLSCFLSSRNEFGWSKNKPYAEPSPGLFAFIQFVSIGQNAFCFPSQLQSKKQLDTCISYYSTFLFLVISFRGHFWAFTH